MIQTPRKPTQMGDHVDQETSKENLIDTLSTKPKSNNFFGKKKKVDVVKNEKNYE